MASFMIWIQNYSDSGAHTCRQQKPSAMLFSKQTPGSPLLQPTFVSTTSLPAKALGG